MTVLLGGWKSERGNSPEPRVLEGLDETDKRYENPRVNISIGKAMSDKLKLA